MEKSDHCIIKDHFVNVIDRMLDFFNNHAAFVGLVAPRVRLRALSRSVGQSAQWPTKSHCSHEEHENFWPHDQY